MDKMISNRLLCKCVLIAELGLDLCRRDIAPFIDHIQFFVRRYMLGHSVAQPDVQSPDKPRKGRFNKVF